MDSLTVYIFFPLLTGIILLLLEHVVIIPLSRGRVGRTSSSGGQVPPLARQHSPRERELTALQARLPWILSPNMFAVSVRIFLILTLLPGASLAFYGSLGGMGDVAIRHPAVGQATEILYQGLKGAIALAIALAGIFLIPYRPARVILLLWLFTAGVVLVIGAGVAALKGIMLPDYVRIVPSLGVMYLGVFVETIIARSIWQQLEVFDE